MAERMIKMLYPFVEKLKKDKKILLIVLIGFFGIILIFLSEMPSERTESIQNGSSHIKYEIKDDKASLEEIISKMKGVGKVTVMIKYKGTSESVFANKKSQQISESGTKEENDYIIIDKGSSEDGLLIKEIYPEVSGIAVVCEGGGSPTIKNEITQMLKSLYSLSSNSISVTEMN